MAFACLAGLGLAACGGEDARFEPEVHHCAAVAGLASEDFGEITVTRVNSWMLEDVRSVQLNFDYAPGGALKSGYIVCAYDFNLSLRADPERVPKAKSVYYKGRYFSAGELSYVNTSPFRPAPEFKISP